MYSRGVASPTLPCLHWLLAFVLVTVAIEHPGRALAPVGGAAARPTPWRAWNKMHLAVGSALGNAIQIALFVAPVLVLLSYGLAPAVRDLGFGRLDLGCLFLAVLTGTVVGGDGHANRHKDLPLSTAGAIMALLFCFLP